MLGHALAVLTDEAYDYLHQNACAAMASLARWEPVLACVANLDEWFLRCCARPSTTSALGSSTHAAEQLRTLGID